ncbi:50S ribosomal protein L16 [Candidatus Korarchaeum cryptofilum]|jgi:large subunit ribosomal protein L10e|uniref:50S ribosomal protein L16 n=1 Tax=Candidatus Korarchaeum cryptofilum TaxID=498846 RepID=A0A3R9WYQ5_9CREN|nr:50S ribosomal protein L16 [Candidatus Korarchaeum cryptofilum]RSN69329.1 50S ribosomal protein L16 [Candidatus Korarchaeum cryptofilum]
MSLRPARNYRALQRPYTRKEYIKSIPYSKITKFDHGNVHGKFEYEVRMVAEASFQVRSNALEAARMTVLSQVRKAIPSDEAYFFKVVHYPHHILRKHAMAGVHKAERLQKGMRLAFGKPDARAAQIRRGDVIMFMRVNEQHLETAKYCMKLAKLKIPYMTRIDVVRLDGTEDEEGA